MSTVDSTAPGGTPPVARPGAGRAVTALAIRQTWRAGLIVVGLVAGLSAMVVGTYRSTVGDSLDVEALRALAANPAVRTLFGEPVALDQPGGFAVWRTGTVLAVLLSVWGLLAATRITRGEEDTGRWDLLLAGRLPLVSVLLRHITVLFVLMVAAGGAVTCAMTAAGATRTGAVLHGAGLASIGVFFVAVGGLAGQVFPARAGASGAAIALLGAGLLGRMLGDGFAPLGWLRWLSPFGLVSLSRPYDANRVLPLLVLGVAGIAVIAGAAGVAAHRDVRGGWLAASSGRAARTRMLGSTRAFALRQSLRPLAGWTTGVGAYFLLIGVLAVSMTGFLTDNPTFADLAARAGFAGLGSVRGYAATMFALLAVPVGVFVAVRLAWVAAEETDRRLTLLYAQPVTRTGLLAAECAATLAGAVALATVAGFAIAVGTATVGADLGLLPALAGAWNVLPIALLCLGAAVFALGWAPRAVAAIGALPAVGGFLWKVIADSVGAPAWVSSLTPFAHLALVPDVSVDWPAAGVMTVIAVTGGCVGAVGYRRRDLRG